MRYFIVIAFIMFVIAVSGCTDNKYSDDYNRIVDGYSGNITIVDKKAITNFNEDKYLIMFKKIDYDPQYKNNDLLTYDPSHVWSENNMTLYYNTEIGHTYHVMYKRDAFRAIDERTPIVQYEVYNIPKVV